MRVQGSLGLSRTGLGGDVEAYSTGARLGFLLLHEPPGQGATLGLNAGMSTVVLAGEGADAAPVFALSVGPELAVAIPASDVALLVPSLSVERSTAFVLGGEREVGGATVVGGSLGLLLRTSDALRFVLEPGLARSGGTTTFSFSLKMFAER